MIYINQLIIQIYNFIINYKSKNLNFKTYYNTPPYIIKQYGFNYTNNDLSHFI